MPFFEHFGLLEKVFGRYRKELGSRPCLATKIFERISIQAIFGPWA
jgi:hypothetical protein